MKKVSWSERELMKMNLIWMETRIGSDGAGALA
jgi:hypothetical protein